MLWHGSILLNNETAKFSVEKDLSFDADGRQRDECEIFFLCDDVEFVSAGGHLRIAHHSLAGFEYEDLSLADACHYFVFSEQ